MRAFPSQVRTLSPCKMLVVSRRAFPKFLTLVPDIRQRLERTKQLRKKQSELTVQYNEDSEEVKADQFRRNENDARRGSDLQKKNIFWAIEQHVPAFSSAAATRLQRRWRRKIKEKIERRKAAEAEAAARRKEEEEPAARPRAGPRGTRRTSTVRRS